MATGRPSHAFVLTDDGIEQARQAGEWIDARFGSDSFDAYFASTYQRTQETFAEMFRGRKKNGHQIEPIIDARINEICRGYPGRLGEERIAAEFPEEVITYALNGWYHNIPLCGQSCVELEHIIHSFLAFLRETCNGKRVLIAGHGTWINLCCRILTNRSISETENLHYKKFYLNCGVTVFEKDEQGHLRLTEENVKPWK
jgi:broad specificity phosphatase PhoE